MIYMSDGSLEIYCARMCHCMRFIVCCWPEELFDVMDCLFARAHLTTFLYLYFQIVHCVVIIVFYAETSLRTC